MIELRALSAGDMERVRLWRNEAMETLRTPFMLTREMQEQYYRDVICNRQSTTRYWGVWTPECFIGYGGIENIQWENRLGEISLLIGPNHRRKGYGLEAAMAILNRAFDELNLETVQAEVYHCNVAGLAFWREVYRQWAQIPREGHAPHFSRGEVTLPRRKYRDGKYHDATFLTFQRET